MNKDRDGNLNREINILYQFNEAYAVFAGVSMTSLFENNRDILKLNVYVLDEDISEASKEKLKSNAARYNRDVTFCKTTQLVEYMKGIGIPAYRNSYATNMKMFVPNFFKGNVERMLYIDSDTIIEGSISSVYGMDMHGKPIAMALDAMGGKHKELVGLSKTDEYFNAGVILFDMKKWNECGCTEMIIEHVKNVRAHYMSPDQDLLNIVLRDKIERLDLKNNLQPVYMAYDIQQVKHYFEQCNDYSATMIKDAIKNPTILHTFRFLGQFPWHKNSLHPATKEFDKYLEKSVWKNYSKKESEQNGLVFKIERALYKYLPHRAFLFIFKLNYDWFIYRASKASEKQKNISEM